MDDVSIYNKSLWPHCELVIQWELSQSILKAFSSLEDFMISVSRWMGQ